MISYTYTSSCGPLKFELDPQKNQAIVFLNTDSVKRFEGYEALAKGQEFTIGTDRTFFAKLINTHEGFSVMENDIHLTESAGHPQTLLKRTLPLLVIASFLLLTKLALIVTDLIEKKELTDFFNDALQVQLYLGYTTLLPALSLIFTGYAARGKWYGPVVVALLLFTDLIFTVGMLWYYQTGIHLSQWIMLSLTLLVLFRLALHWPIIRYVKKYTQSLQSTN